MRTLRLGDTEVSHIRAGDFRLDGGAMFGVVPKALWSRLCPPDDLNRIPLACNCLLLRRESGLVLVETGCGDRFTPKEREIYAVGHTSLTASLEQAGVRPEEITHVLLTHLHFDHAAGALQVRDGKLVPTCENALHLTQRGEWEDALAGRSVMKSSYVTRDLEALRKSARWQLLDGDEEILPGLSVQVTGGHTPHHQAIFLRDGGRTLVYPGDVLPTRAHLSPYWIMAYDMDPFQTFEVKNALVSQASAENWIIGWNHDAESEFSILRQGGRGVEAAEPDF